MQIKKSGTTQALMVAGIGTKRVGDQNMFVAGKGMRGAGLATSRRAEPRLERLRNT